LLVVVVVSDTLPPALVVVVVDEVCAKAVLSATAPAAPAANILINRVCFIICPLLWLNGCSPLCITLTSCGRPLFDRIYDS
jgi:hypothetical protein